MLLGFRAYVKAAKRGRLGGIDVVNLDVGTHLVVECEVDGGDGGEAAEEGSGSDLGGSLGEGRAPSRGFRGWSLLFLLPFRQLVRTMRVSNREKVGVDDGAR